MRDAFHDDLDAIGQSLVEMSELVSKAMLRATKAILEADLALAEEVISEDERIDSLHHDLDARTLNLMARQQPVAGDLRTLVTSIRMSSDLERMGDLAHHIAKLARMRYPACAVPPELVFIVQEMGDVAQKIINKTTGIPLYYELGQDLKPLKKGGEYLDPAAAQEAIAAVANQGKK